MRKKIFFVVWVLLFFTVVRAGYPASGTRTVIDSVGRKVVIPEKVNRVVAIYGTCNVPTFMSALGVADKLVSGLCFRFPGEDLQIKVEPSYAKINAFKFNGEGFVDVEELMALKPDVVFVWKGYVKNVDAIEAAGIPVVICYISTWNDLKDRISLIGEVTGVPDRADKLVAYMETLLKRVETKAGKIPAEKRKKVLMIENFKPLTAPGNEGFGGFLIETGGGISVTSKLPGYMPETSMEAIYAADPDVIIFSANQRAGYDSLTKSPEWAGLRAVKLKQVYLTPRGVFMWNKANVETGLYLLWQTSKIYPELVSEKEVRDEAVAFYKTFFRHTLSRQELDGLFDHQ